MRRPMTVGESDLFGESDEDIQVDEAWWDDQFARSQDVLLRLAEEVAEEYRTDQTTPMEFDEHSRLRR
jgi:hypothetical protein